MMVRFSFAGRRPSASAAFQPPEYQAQLTFLADSVSPIVLADCGGKGAPMRASPLGSARSSEPSAAGGMPLGWYGGCEVLTEKPSGVTCPPMPPLWVCTAPSRAEGESGVFESFP